MDRFLQQALDQPYVQGDLCILTSIDISSMTHTTCPPVNSFHSPFLGWTVEALNDFVESNVHAKEPLNEKFYVVLDEETATSGNSCLLVENVVERRRRFSEQRLSPTPGYDDDEKIKSVRSSFEEALQSVSALDISSMDMQEMIDG